MSNMATPETETQSLPEGALTPEDWRFIQFKQQGFNAVQIDVLTLRKVDHHDSERLLQRGCSHDLVVDILR